MKILEDLCIEREIAILLILCRLKMSLKNALIWSLQNGIRLKNQLRRIIENILIN